MSESFAYAACMTRKALLSLSRQVLTQAMHTRTHTEFFVLKTKPEAPKKILCMVPRPLSHKANNYHAHQVGSRGALLCAWLSKTTSSRMCKCENLCILPSVWLSWGRLGRLQVACSWCCLGELQLSSLLCWRKLAWCLLLAWFLELLVAWFLVSWVLARDLTCMLLDA